jgi:hypothetical protein
MDMKKGMAIRLTIRPHKARKIADPINIFSFFDKAITFSY